ncbi:MAG: DNA repair exonuclease [Pirellulaceae bacterium]|nr:DNA repair exonuclease [Pirellulaceae bacterium]
MARIRFLHAADVHLDSPLCSLRSLDEATATQLHRASRRSIETIVQTAITQKVAAVVFAGDLFDGPVKDAGAGLWVESQLKRLVREKIAVVLIRGNHDAVSNAQRVIHWSDGIYELSSDAPQTVLLDEARLAIHGQSFGARAESTDLAAAYPSAVMGYFNIGLLHTSLSGSSQHDSYAPTSIGLLESKGYQYWALGHIHQRTEHSLSDKCWIGYSGNTQGRHVRECGAKGCYVVHVEDNHIEKMEFVPTDSLRWQLVSIDLQNAQRLSDIEDLVEDALSPWISSTRDDGVALAVRLHLEGSTSLHAELTQPATFERLSDALALRIHELGDVWLESVKVRTHPAKMTNNADLDVPLKYLALIADEVREDKKLQKEMWKELDELLKKARVELTEVDWPLLNDSERDAELMKMLSQAEDLLVSRLVRAGEA